MRRKFESGLRAVSLRLPMVITAWITGAMARQACTRKRLPESSIQAR